ncbi:ribonuclease domain-containing protein [Polaromonas sp.]|uniref:ribonuclease domain-containing protein n=1 Tax=Polaromonas sp. TaxID=1869339 RepID=UPI00286B0FBC|nr:ribonuclease domain-containing protein [Polaromonas sp.]
MLRNGMGRWRAAGVAALLGLLVGISGFGPGTALAKGPLNSPVPVDPARAIAVAQLPVQGQNMMTLIYQGGPFRYDKDGVVFGNRERILPAQHRGYYREYTVKTPNERSRGARRIVCGGVKPATPDACYYTDDHYASFRRIVQ